MNQDKNREFHERALKVIPGPNSNLRLPSAVEPVYMVEAHGARFRDVNGKEYIDYGHGGQGILGHGNKEYTATLQKQLDKLFYVHTGEFRTTLEVELAEKMAELVPGVEKTRFCVSGTEAVQLAIRLCRAYTRRPVFVRFDGAYHGWMDNILAGKLDENPTGKPYALRSDDEIFPTEGVDPASLQESLKIQYNDFEAIENLLEQHGDEIAMVLIEPILFNGGCCMPRPGYLEKVKELCAEYGAVLCFDEAYTGFRVALDCAQGLLGVIPDLTIFGKALGGGLPLAAVAGKREIMDLFLEWKVFHAGTFNAYPFGMAAGLANMSILEKDDGAYYEHMARLQGRLMKGLKEIGSRNHVPLLIQGPSTGGFFMTKLDIDIAHSPADLKGMDKQLHQEMVDAFLEEGIMLIRSGRWYPTGGLTDEDVDETLDRSERVFRKVF